MSEQSPVPTEMKPCPYCGRSTSAKANFCWWCARELSARPERPESAAAGRKPLPRWAWIALGIVIVAAIVLSTVLR